MFQATPVPFTSFLFIASTVVAYVLSDLSKSPLAVVSVKTIVSCRSTSFPSPAYRTSPLTQGDSTCQNSPAFAKPGRI